MKLNHNHLLPIDLNSFEKGSGWIKPPQVVCLRLVEIKKDAERRKKYCLEIYDSEMNGYECVSVKEDSDEENEGEEEGGFTFTQNETKRYVSSFSNCSEFSEPKVMKGEYITIKYTVATVVETLKFKIMEQKGCADSDTKVKIMGKIHSKTNELWYRCVMNLQRDFEDKLRFSKEYNMSFSRSHILTSKSFKELRPVIRDLEKDKDGLGIIDNWELVYRASRDGFGRADFIEKARGREHNIVIVKSKEGRIFGGYTPGRWDEESKEGDTNHYRNLPKSFLFGFSDGRIVKLECTNSKYSIYTRPSHYALIFGCCSGNGHALYITDFCNLNKTSQSSLRGANGYGHKGYGEFFLAGERTFQVEDYELFAFKLT